MTEENKIVWELKDGKVFIHDQSNPTALGLRIQFAATKKEFDDFIAEYSADLVDVSDPASIEYLQGVVDAIEQARQSWQASLDSADPAP